MTGPQIADPSGDERSLAERVEALRRRTSELAGESGLRAPTSPAGEGRPTAIFVGEPGRGKTSLINALLGRPLLLPEGDDGLPCYVVVRHGPPSALLHLTGMGDVVELELERLGEWFEGGKDSQMVAWLEVRLEVPLLQSLDLVDTPASAAANLKDASATVHALGQTDVLVFVADGRSPLTAPELRYLEGLSPGSVATLFVLARRDLYPAWQQIASDNRALLERHAPAYADMPFWAVSSRLAAQATLFDQPGRNEAARRAEERSGIAALHDALTSLATAELGGLRLAGTVRATDAVLRQLMELEESQLVEPSDEAHQQALSLAQERLEAFQRESGDYMARVSDEFTRVEVGLRRTLTRTTQDLLREWTRRIGGSSTRDLDLFPAVLERDIAAMLGRLQDEFRVELDAVISRLETSLAVAVAHATAQTGLGPGLLPLARIPERGVDEPTQLRRAEQVLQAAGLLVGAGGPMVVANLVGDALGLGLGAIVAPYALAAGLVLGGLRLFHQRRSKDLATARQQASGVVRDALENVRTEVPSTLALKLLEVRRSVEADVRELVRERSELLRRERDELQRRAAEDSAARARMLQKSRQRLRSIQGGRRIAADLLVELESRQKGRRS